MFNVVVVLCVLLHVSLSVTDETVCPQGETWMDCGTACPATCAVPKPEVCTRQCVRGCFCNEGLIRDEDTKKCIPLKDCRCPEGERWTECGSACNATCADQNPICTLQCVPRCSCIQGYVRDECNNNKCIPLQKCPKQ